MPLIGMVMATIVCQLYALHARRHTWVCRHERAITTSILLNALALLAMSPIYPPEVDVLGHLFMLGSLAAMAYAINSRVDTKQDPHWRFQRIVVLPLVIAVPIMLACRLFSPAELDFYTATPLENMWLAVYGLAFWKATGFMMYVIIPGLVVLCRDQRWPNVAPHTLFGACCHSIAGLLIVAPTLMAQPVPVALVWILMCLSSVTVSLSAAYSWKCKSRPVIDHRLARRDIATG